MSDLAARRRWDGEEARAQRRLTLPQILTAHARERPDAIAFSFLPDGETVETELTFAELDRRACAIAAHLAGFESCRAVLVYPSSAEFVAALFGCLYAGVVAVHAPLVRGDRALSRVEVVAAGSDAAVVLAPRDLLARHPASPGSPLTDLPWLATDELAGGATQGELPALTPAPAPDPDRLALIQFTSGTTGTARGVPLRHSQLTHQAAALQAGLDTGRASVTVGWTPLFHDMGLFLTVIEPVYTGHRAVVIFPLAFLARPRRWLEAMTRYRGTISGGPNFAYELAARDVTAEEAGTLELASWRAAVIGGEQVRPATLARFAAAFAPAAFDPRAFDPGYGLAEATCAVTGRAGFLGAGIRRFDAEELRHGRAVESATGREVASAGFARGDQECLIVDPHTSRPVADGVIGELWVSGPGVADGYWNDPEATAEVFGARLALAPPDTRSFLRTGDLAFGLDGELFVVGRIKELIIVRGRNILPQDVEATVQASHPALRPGCGAAFALDSGAGELLVVAQELRDGATEDPNAVKAAIGDAVRADHEIEPHAIVLLPPRSIPKTTSGKIQRKLCRTCFITGVWPVATGTA